MKRYIATLMSLALVFGLGACLLSLTESFEYDVFKEHGLTEIDLTGSDGHEENIDFTTDSTFNDNKDDIKNIDRVEFAMNLYTANTSTAIVDVWFREPADAGEDENDYLKILDGVNVPGGSDETTQLSIRYADSGDYITNFASFQKLAESGRMDLLVSARTGNDEVIITKLVIYVAITAGK